MRKFISIIILALCAVFAVTSCETLDPNKDFSGTIYGFWVIDKLEVDASITVNGHTTSSISTTDYSSGYARLLLDTSGIATVWYNLDWGLEGFGYDESMKRITIKGNDLHAGSDAKAISFLGMYDVILDGDTMVLKQPEASLGLAGYGVSERATYYLHRAPKSEKPKETNK